MAKKEKHKGVQRVSIKNRRVTFDYEILDTFVAGIELLGTEIKSIRQGKASLVDTFCIVHRGEVWVKNMYIGPYSFGSYNNHAERRDRKLLLNKKEIREIDAFIKDAGNTVVPLKLFINDKGLAKLQIGLARGKKQYDKRAAIKEREAKRDLDYARKHRY